MKYASNPARYIARAVRRFWEKVEVQPNGCWLWTGCIAARTRTSAGGYGLFHFKGKTVTAHRWCWQRCYGPVPEGLEIDHLCRNRACCNPTHMEAVTHTTNVRRGRSIHREKTHCPRGHAYTPENTRRGRNRPSRFCRACAREYKLMRRANPEYRPRAYRTSHRCCGRGSQAAPK